MNGHGQPGHLVAKSAKASPIQEVKTEFARRLAHGLCTGRDASTAFTEKEH